MATEFKEGSLHWRISSFLASYPPANRTPRIFPGSAKILSAYLNAVNIGDLEKDGYQHRIVEKLQTLNDNLKDYSIKPKSFFSKVGDL